MVKISAYILLAALVAFISETIKIPLSCPETKTVEACSGCKTMKMEQQSCSKNEKRQSNNNNIPSKCVDCPLFSVLIYHPVAIFQKHDAFIKREYSLLQISSLTDYSTELFKPPNVT